VPNSCLGAGAGAGFNCGGAGGTTDCCASYLVPGGTFYRDYDGVDYDSESYPATISPVLVDAFEVTVGRFRNFVSAVVGGWTPVPGSGKHSNLNDGDGLVLPSGVGAEYEPGWLLSWTANLPATSAGWNAHLASCDGDAGAYYATWTLGDDTLPINCLDWYDAYAFCIWDGGFLPSTAEWNFTASGGDAQRLFAWGENPPGANTIYANWNCYEHGVTGACDARWTAPVGSSPEGNGRWGQSDLTGNLYEFVLDFWSEYPPNPCSDCADTTDGPRMIRGGSFSNSIESLYVANTSYYTPETATLINVGFRCARSP
jgi:formylglycine-generating enzyme required for sulfatase activity